MLAKEAEARGDLKLATSYYQQSVSISPDMVHRLMQTLDTHGVHYMVAPFESDAQLAYLSLMNIIDVVITEDSDSIVYGCRAVFLKIDKDGNGDLLERKKLVDNQSLSFGNWTDDQFKLFCCLAGCDYMPKIPSVGIKIAYKLISKHQTLSKAVEQLMQMQSGKISSIGMMTREELTLSLERALMTFKHQTVYDPVSGGLCPLVPIPLHAISRHPDLSFLGVVTDRSIVPSLVAGKLNVQTMKLFSPFPTNTTVPSVTVVPSTTTSSSHHYSDHHQHHHRSRLRIWEENTELVDQSVADESTLWGFHRTVDTEDAPPQQIKGPMGYDHGRHVTWMVSVHPEHHRSSVSSVSANRQGSCIDFSSTLVCRNLPLIRKRFPVVDTSIIIDRSSVISTRVDSECSHENSSNVYKDDDDREHHGVEDDVECCSRGVVESYSDPLEIGNRYPTIESDSSFIDDDGNYSGPRWSSRPGDDDAIDYAYEGEPPPPPVSIMLATAPSYSQPTSQSSGSYSHACQVAHTAVLLLHSLELHHHHR